MLSETWLRTSIAWDKDVGPSRWYVNPSLVYPMTELWNDVPNIIIIRKLITTHILNAKLVAQIVNIPVNINWDSEPPHHIYLHPVSPSLQQKRSKGPEEHLEYHRDKETLEIRNTDTDRFTVSTKRTLKSRRIRKIFFFKICGLQDRNGFSAESFSKRISE